MSLERYDLALLNKLKSVFPNTLFSSLSKALEHETDIELNSAGINDKVSKKTSSAKKVAVPMIVFDRINNPLNFEFGANDPLVRRGRYIIQGTENEGVPTREKSIPVNIQYQIDIISDKRIEVDGIWRELVMFLYTKPCLDVEFDFDGESFVESFPLRITDTDNTTDVEDFSNNGRIYRQTLSVEVVQAKLLFIDRVNIIEQFPLHIIELIEDGEVDV